MDVSLFFVYRRVVGDAILISRPIAICCDPEKAEHLRICGRHTERL